MSLNYEVARYTELTGEDGTKVSVSRLGGFLDGYEKGKSDMLKEIEEAMYTQCFERDNDEDMQKWDSGNWFRYKLFEQVLEHIANADKKIKE